MTTDASNAVETREAAPAWQVPERAAYWVVQLAPFVLAFAVYLAAFLVMQPDATGDEPHYMLAAQSMAFDGDLDLQNDYASRERTLRAVKSFPLGADFHAADYRDTGQLRPIRGIGFSTLLAPAAGLGGLTGARLLMVLIAALVADQLFRLLRDLGFRRKYASLAWAAVALCYPMLVFSSQLYPELPAALLIVVAMRVMVRHATSSFALAMGSSAAALLVWLQVRFIALAFGVLFGLVVAACRAHRRGAAAPRPAGLSGVVRAAWGELALYVRVLAREWRVVTVPLAVPFLAYLALFAVVSYHLYGTAHPTAPYDAFYDYGVGSAGRSFLYTFALADVLDPVQGWIPYVPVHWLGLAALGCLVLRWRWAAAACIAVPVGYELLIASAGITPGWGFPARYLIPVIVLIAVPLALVIQQVRAARFVFVPLLAVSLVVAAAAVRQHLHLYPASDRPRLLAARSFPDVFPATNPYPFPTSYVLSPGEFGPSTGELQGSYAVARPGDPPAALLFGPYAQLRRGAYRATFQLSATGAEPGSRVAAIDVLSEPPVEVLASRWVTAGELAPGRMRDIALEFSNPNGGLIETRVFYDGRGTVRAGQIRVEPVRVGAYAPGRLPDWPVALAWILGTAGAGWLLVLGMKRAQRDDAAPRAATR